MEQPAGDHTTAGSQKSQQNNGNSNNQTNNDSKQSAILQSVGLLHVYFHSHSDVDKLTLTAWQTLSPHLQQLIIPSKKDGSADNLKPTLANLDTQQQTISDDTTLENETAWQRYNSLSPAQALQQQPSVAKPPPSKQDEKPDFERNDNDDEDSSQEELAVEPYLATWRKERPNLSHANLHIQSYTELPREAEPQKGWRGWLERLYSITHSQNHPLTDPSSAVHRTWVSLVILSVIWVCIITPFEMAFFAQNVLENHAYIKWIDLALDILFIFDIVKSLTTGYDRDTGINWNWRKNAWRYTRDGTLFFDVLSITPLPMLFFPQSPILAGYQLVRVARIYKIPLYIRQLVRGNNYSRTYSILRLLKYFIGVLILQHIVACLWIFIGFLQVYNDPSVCDWMSTTSDTCTGVGVITADEFTIYSVAYLFSAASMVSSGYGITAPISNVDVIFTAAWQCLGNCYFAVLESVAQLVTIFALNDTVNNNFTSKLRSVISYLRYHHAPQELQDDVTNYYEYAFHRRKTYPFYKSDLLSDLNSSLWRRVMASTTGKLLINVPLFKSVDTKLVHRLTYQSQMVLLIPGNKLVTAGERLTAMYVVASGALEVVNSDGEVVKVLEPGDFFGVHALFVDIVSPCTVRAIIHSELLRLRRSELYQISRTEPEFRAPINKLRKQVEHELQKPLTSGDHEARAQNIEWT